MTSESLPLVNVAGGEYTQRLFHERFDQMNALLGGLAVRMRPNEPHFSAGFRFQLIVEDILMITSLYRTHQESLTGPPVDGFYAYRVLSPRDTAGFEQPTPGYLLVPNHRMREELSVDSQYNELMDKIVAVTLLDNPQPPMLRDSGGH